MVTTVTISLTFSSGCANTKPLNKALSTYILHTDVFVKEFPSFQTQFMIIQCIINLTPEQKKFLLFTLKRHFLSFLAV